ncbi:MAG: type II toxin-antitoxin system PemK/MazF family toxin [Candidatus Omnitrophica bacterium]|nr:type II toxin-antitoxin system PemK/MazF family toxin [Candidatus Omnitrophota bacterium]
MSIRRGDIVLVPFPFTDLTSVKVRPALIVSDDPQNQDVIIAFISSVVPAKLKKTEYLLNVNDPDFFTTGLKTVSVIKMNKLLTISSALILRRLGRVNPELQQELNKLLKLALGL